MGDWAVGVNGSEMYVTLDAKTRWIADYAFYGATVLEVNIPQTVEIIGRAAFYNCMFLLEATLSSSIESINYYMF